MKKSPPPPLLSRLSQLFRKPAPEEAPDSENTVPAKQAETDALKLRFRQKRRDDAIRRKEFNQLRSVIRDSMGVRTPKPPSFFVPPPAARSSGMGALGRDSILNKIDGAQAHLEQWWGSESGHATITRMPEDAASIAAQLAAEDDDDLDLDFTGLSSAAPLANDDAEVAGQPEEDYDSELTPLESGLRDAALLFAEGEFEAAQTVLCALLESPDLDSVATELLTFALFDVYRCAGQQERFDALALDYAKRFGRSPAEWFSVSEAALPGHTMPDNEMDSAPPSYWECPAILDTRALANGIAPQSTHDGICAIDWSALQHIDAATAMTFARQVTAWCDRPVELHWLGIDALTAALQMCRVSGDASANQPWWLIQLDMLCLLRKVPEFEDLALEYCMAFEVSPPSWKTVASKLFQPHDALPVLEFVATVPNSTYETVPLDPNTYAVCELRGNITGDMPKALRELRKAAATVAQISVSCARLGRIDFRAAAALMGWAEECGARGCQVQFKLLPRLVLVYFHMLGMEKMASLSAGSY